MEGRVVDVLNWLLVQGGSRRVGRRDEGRMEVDDGVGGGWKKELESKGLGEARRRRQDANNELTRALSG